MRMNFKQISFRKQVIYITSVLLITLSLVVAMVTALVSRTELKSLLLSQGKEWSQSLAKNSVTAFLYRDAEIVRDSVQTMMDTGKIDQLILRAIDGEIILQQEKHKGLPQNHTQQLRINKEFYEDDTSWFFNVAVNSGFNAMVSTEKDEGGFIDSALASEQTTQILGYVQMRLSKDYLNAPSRQVFVSNLLIALVLSFIVILVLLALTRRMFMPLENLATVMKQTSQGGWKTYTDLSGAAEIRDISITYNKMINTLQERDEELVQANINLEAKVKRRTEELEDSNTQLEAFNYSVSHDLRTPLRSIDGFSNILMEDLAEQLGEEGRSYLVRIKKAANRMGELIDDMLSLSRISRKDIQPQTIMLDQICNEILEPLLETGEKRKIEIVINKDLEAFADLGMAWVLLENLIGNAWKYSSKSDVTYIEIGKLAGHEDCFYLKDKGVGFDMQYADKLFLPFQRLHRADDFEGSGIGLATVKRIIDKHDGRIWFESVINEGTVFYFSFGHQDQATPEI